MNLLTTNSSVAADQLGRVNSLCCCLRSISGSLQWICESVSQQTHAAAATAIDIIPMNNGSFWRAESIAIHHTAGVQRAERNVSSPVIACGEARKCFAKLGRAFTVMRGAKAPADLTVGKLPTTLVVIPASRVNQTLVVCTKR